MGKRTYDWLASCGRHARAQWENLEIRLWIVSNAQHSLYVLKLRMEDYSGCSLSFQRLQDPNSSAQIELYALQST
jgi:hypothetical protein